MRKEIYRMLLRLYKETLKEIHRIDPASDKLVLNDAVCDMNKRYCDEAARVIKNVVSKMHGILTLASQHGYKELVDRITVFIEHDWGPDSETYDPMDILRVAEALIGDEDASSDSEKDKSKQ